MNTGGQAALHFHSLHQTEKRKLNHTFGTIWNPLQYETAFEPRQRQRGRSKTNQFELELLQNPRDLIQQRQINNVSMQCKTR